MHRPGTIRALEKKHVLDEFKHDLVVKIRVPASIGDLLQSFESRKEAELRIEVCIIVSSSLTLWYHDANLLTY
jgi:hypothetical protein